MAPPQAVHIIDDDAAVRDSMAVMLETRGFDVATYASGRAFLAQGEVAGCVVTDVQMPDMDGLQLLRAFRARTPDVPVLLVTARSRRALADDAVAQGAQAVIEKPFRPDDLVAMVQAALAGAAPA